MEQKHDKKYQTLDIDEKKVHYENISGSQNIKRTSVKKIVKNPYSVTPSPKYNSKIRQSMTNFERLPSASHQYTKIRGKSSVMNPYKKTHCQENLKKTDIPTQERTTDEASMQYPHHAGRFRADRQFRTNLTIEGSDMNESANSYERNREKWVPQSDCTYLNDSNFEASFDQENDDDDDDDDDELLSYVTFEKKDPRNK